MNGDVYSFKKHLNRLSDQEVIALRDEWQRFYPEVVDYFERLQDAEAREEGRKYERTRKLKGGLMAVVISALGVGVFIGLCLVWGKR